MQLKVLARAIAPRRLIGSLDREVESIAYDSRRVQGNTLFVAIRGEKSDGHQFVDQAIEQGASVIVAEREISSPRATCLVVGDSRAALADLSTAFYGMPARKLKVAARPRWRSLRTRWHRNEPAESNGTSPSSPI